VGPAEEFIALDKSSPNARMLGPTSSTELGIILVDSCQEEGLHREGCDW
jgi:hypothetical protein